jgi:hypothetical protein
VQLSRSFWLLGGLLWIVLLAAGWHILLRHEQTPGADGQVPEHMPTDTMLPLDPERPTLILFAHRSCPCTRVTLQEYEHILTHSPGHARALVVLVAPAGTTTDRVGGEIENRARALPGAEVVVDPQGSEARRFRVRTSGHVVLYNCDGRLMFSGGITQARGHAGDSAGRRAVVAWLGRQQTGPGTTPVYGCSLFAGSGEREEEVPP